MVLTIMVAPVVMNSAFADPAPKQDPSCSDPKFADRDICPGKSEDASGILFIQLLLSLSAMDVEYTSNHMCQAFRKS
jgi:hypothetical protein